MSRVRQQTSTEGIGKSTFAISVQVLPPSRIVFSLCSSLGVHGVFVRDFFGDDLESGKEGTLVEGWCS